MRAPQFSRLPHSRQPMQLAVPHRIKCQTTIPAAWCAHEEASSSSLHIRSDRPATMAMEGRTRVLYAALLLLWVAVRPRALSAVAEGEVAAVVEPLVKVLRQGEEASLMVKRHGAWLAGRLGPEEASMWTAPT
jgi:hypothetical protein